MSTAYIGSMYVRENLRALYPIAEVPVPRDGDKIEKKRIAGMNDDEDDKQTYRDFVDIIRYARGPPDLSER